MGDSGVVEDRFCFETKCMIRERGSSEGCLNGRTRKVDSIDCSSLIPQNANQHFDEWKLQCAMIF
jgi:hypothetical protein